MEIIIRKENENDYFIVEKIIKEAFENEAYSDHKEHFLVSRLRKSNSFIPELSLVAEYDGLIVGHILLTKLIIKNENEKFDSLALAPVSVKKEFQNKGVGSKLILESHKVAKELGYKSIILLGHKDYYPRFGYEPTVKYNIKSPFEVQDDFYMIVKLEENALDNVSGLVEYPQEFFE
jgi:predicted N-acetyltransferase YhbS